MKGGKQIENSSPSLSTLLFIAPNQTLIEWDLVPLTKFKGRALCQWSRKQMLKSCALASQGAGCQQGGSLISINRFNYQNAPRYAPRIIIYTRGQHIIWRQLNLIYINFPSAAGPGKNLIKTKTVVVSTARLPPKGWNFKLICSRRISAGAREIRRARLFSHTYCCKFSCAGWEKRRQTVIWHRQL